LPSAVNTAQASRVATSSICSRPAIPRAPIRLLPTAAALFWSLYLIAVTPAEQDALAAETEAVDLGPAGAADAVPQLVRTRAVVDEVLRSYPPAFVIVRQAVEDDIVTGIPVPLRSLVLIAPLVLHRHRRIWRDPDSFEPSRFLPGAPQPPRFAYVPFGIGPRTCIGAQFALTDLVLILSAMVRAFRVELAEPRVVNPVGIVSTQPDDPPAFVLQRR
jgi:cytochrome P450